jgi:hypothetical protein
MEPFVKIPKEIKLLEEGARAKEMTKKEHKMKKICSWHMCHDGEEI